MGETFLPAGCWIMVAMIAAFTVWMCLSAIGAAVEYERNRLNLGREVRDLQRRYSLSFPSVFIAPDTVNDIGADKKAA